MRDQNRQTYIAFTVAVLVIAGLGGAWTVVQNFDNLDAISSTEVDKILYKQLYEYERSYREDPELASIFTTALTAAEELTKEERQIYLVHERKFIAGWEVAWSYKDAGYFEDDRYDVWNAWYVDELRRRPPFTWQENKQFFPQTFVRHVDDIVPER